MKTIIKIFALTILSLTLFTGCKTTTLSSIVTPVKTFESNEKLESSIVYGAINAKWEVIKVSDNLLRAKYSYKKYVAIVDIPFNENEYEIKYYDSANLQYNKEDKSIHKLYYKWVMKLRRYISSAIAKGAVYSGVLYSSFDDTHLKNEHNKPYNKYYLGVDKLNFDEKKISILKAKNGYGFIKIDGTVMKQGLAKFVYSSNNVLIDYVYMKPGIHTVALADTNGRIDTLIFPTEPGHEYLFDYGEADGELAYWIQDLSANERVEVEYETSLVDRAFRAKILGLKVN